MDMNRYSFCYVMYLLHRRNIIYIFYYVEIIEQEKFNKIY